MDRPQENALLTRTEAEDLLIKAYPEEPVDIILRHVFPELTEMRAATLKANQDILAAIAANNAWIEGGKPDAEKDAVYTLMSSSLDTYNRLLDDYGSNEIKASTDLFEKYGEILLLLYEHNPEEFLATDKDELLERAKAANNIPSLGGRRTKALIFPLDKVNTKIWRPLGTDASKLIPIRAEKRGSKKELNIYFSLNFDDLPTHLTMSKELKPFDKRVYMAIGSLWNSGLDRISLGQIYDAMGYSGEPGTADYKRIDESLTKMAFTHLYLDNAEEAKAYRYPRFPYDAQLLPMERVRCIINGKLVDSAIHLFREPPLLSFAKDRNQITTINKKLLNSPLNKTDANILIEDYLISRISHARAGTLSKTIKLETFFEETLATTAKQKQRAVEKAKRLLDYYCEFKEDNFLAGYKITDDSIVLSFRKN